jgi:hypothetical protein
LKAALAKEKVPKRLLSREFKDWSKHVKMVQGIIKRAAARPVTFRELLREANAKLEELGRMEPEKKLEELAQQPRERA